MPINVLSDALAARIAAGEVIERPASVVKELVENALDAGATRISVTIAGGGLDLVSVVDNGAGIDSSEFELAFARFATSKTDESSDLHGIRTLGFRGEALPSIAAVSYIEAVSRTVNENVASRLVIETGTATTRDRTAAPQGTIVSVRRLFQNVPARLKFISSKTAESTRIVQLMHSYCLIYPTVAFTLVADGDQRVSTAGDGNRVNAVSAVYGPATASAMVTVSSPSTAKVRSDGLTSTPSHSRGNRNFITISINGRIVNSRKLTFAIEQAYHGYLPERRFPVSVIDISLPFEDVDVNVHPAKAEVRFRDDGLVFSELQRAVRSAISEHSTVRPVSSGLTSPPSQPRPTLQSNTALDFSLQLGAGPVQTVTAQPSTSTDLAAASTPDQPGPGDRDYQPPGQRQVMPVLRVIGQAHETYIVAEGPQGLYLIDQHAAHERVTYEELRRKLLTGSPVRQDLLTPEVVEVGPASVSAAIPATETLNRLGFLIEPFGPRSLLLRSVPKYFASNAISGSPAQWLIRILDEISESGREASWEDTVLRTVACHSSVRAGQRLSIQEAQALVMQLESTGQPHSCPHGRPTMVHLPQVHLERQFGRK